MGLAQYITETRAILRDRAGLFTPESDLINWINSARREAAELTGCLRCLVPGASSFGGGAQPGSLIPGGATPGALPDSDPNAIQSQTTNTFQTIPGVEKYSFKFANEYLRQTHAGVDSIIDVIDIAVSWGATRPSMSWMPWDDLQAYGRAYNVGVFSYPMIWSTDGDGENANVWLFPCPQTYDEMEWDCTATPKELYTDGDYEAIPRSFQKAIKFGAAKLAYMGSQRFGIADLMQDQFLRNLGITRAASDRGKVQNYYWQS